jgi:acyl carrier protein
MDNLKVKLAKCISLTFPNLEASQIEGASAETVDEWDSLAQVTLLTVIGEEFGVDLDFEGLESSTSFDMLAARLSEMGAR